MIRHLYSLLVVFSTLQYIAGFLLYFPISVPCGVGTYFAKLNNDMEYECHPCPANTYQDEEGQDDCILCPTGTYTQGMHAANATDCQGRLSFIR